MTDEQVEAIYVAYISGGSINGLAEAIGFTPAAARRQLRKRKLPLKGELAGKGAKVDARREQQMITALLMARVDRLRKARRLTVERLAHESDLSMFTLTGLREDLRDPQLNTVLRLCRGLDLTVEELLGDLPLPAQPRPRIPRQPRSRS
jgi:DNA-binding Xre family transcriptional regulator